MTTRLPIEEHLVKTAAQIEHRYTTGPTKNQGGILSWETYYVTALPTGLSALKVMRASDALQDRVAMTVRLAGKELRPLNIVYDFVGEGEVKVKADRNGERILLVYKGTSRFLPFRGGQPDYDDSGVWEVFDDVLKPYWKF
jgi:hypothetical protein